MEKQYETETDGELKTGFESRKLYVSVNADFDKEGRVTPRSVTLPTTGRTYGIDRVEDCVRAASRKAGGCGLRYAVRICRQTAYLYFEDTNPGRWFVALKD